MRAIDGFESDRAPQTIWLFLRAAAVDPYIVDVHRDRIRRGCIGRARPIAADSKVQQQEERMIVESPSGAGGQVGGSERDEGVSGVVDIILDRVGRPEDAVDVVISVG